MKYTLRIASILLFSFSSIALCSQQEEQERYDLLTALGSAVGDRIEFRLSQFFRGGLKAKYDVGCDSQLEEATGVVAFILADYAIKSTVRETKDCASVKKITPIIKEQHRLFFWDEGITVANRIISRAAMLMLRDGIVSSDNIQKLRIFTALDIKDKIISHYIAKPVADEIFGRKNKGYRKMFFCMGLATLMAAITNKLLQSIFLI